MSAASGTYHAVPLRIVSSRPAGSAAATIGATKWASPPPPRLSGRTINFLYMVTLALLSGLVVAGNTILRT